MGKYILALNCGSSSLKFNLFEVGPDIRIAPVMQGIVEEIGNSKRSMLKYTVNGEKLEIKRPLSSHTDALSMVINEIGKSDVNIGEICAVGHRTVHGGDKYKSSVLIDEGVIKTMKELIPIAPLHNLPNITGIEGAMKLLPEVSQVAVFDTAFHGSIPECAFRYAIPDEWYNEFMVRRYGFHGTSHMYVSRRGAKLLDIPYDRFNCITAHLGNGCSITKIHNGKSVDTSMGFTPLEGVVMGTRSGDIDPAVISYVTICLADKKGIGELEAYHQVMNALNKESGLKALGNTNMMQDLRKRAQEGDVISELAISIYAYRTAKYIGAYWSTLPYCNALIFTAGVGENEGYVREKILHFLGNLKVEIDEDKNNKRKQEMIIGKSSINPSAPMHIMVIPTDEEIVIGYDALYLGFLKQPLPQMYPFETD